jgi:hypothetical protein
VTENPADNLIDAMRNVRTGKLFILLDVIPPNKMKVINPNGDILTVVDELFDDDPQEVAVADAPATFTEKQLETYDRYVEEESVRAAVAETRAHEEEAEEKQVTRSRAPAPSSGRTRRVLRRDRSPAASAGGRLVAEWTAPRLTFYRHKIDPLRIKDSFRISVEGEGVFHMTREQFQETFNDVVLASSYRENGIFTYNVTPEKALRFKLPA